MILYILNFYNMTSKQGRQQKNVQMSNGKKDLKNSKKDRK